MSLDTNMIKLSNYIKDHNMYYKMILTYNFSDDDTRSSFEELVEGFGFVEAEDQSTYVLPYGNSLKSTDVTNAIGDWSLIKDIQISKEDFVQLFYLSFLTIYETKVTQLASKYMEYNSNTKGLMLKQ